MRKKIAVIGSGFAGLSAACHLAAEGHEVTVFEKNSEMGGRARTYKEKGFTFDMGPSWYWMPEVFDTFFERFGKKTSDYYELIRLSPAYRIYFMNNERFDVPTSLEELCNAFEKREKGSGAKLRKFLEIAQFKYETAMSQYVGKISDSIFEFLDPKLLINAFRMKLFSSIRKEIRSDFKDPLLVSLLEFPVLFLGSTPATTPALYSMMNYADLVKGTWYPMGGMVKIPEAMGQVAKELGVKILCDHEVRSIISKDSKVSGLICDQGQYDCDVLVSGADYRHTEQKLLDAKDRVYDEAYWNKRVMSPSSLLFYVGLDTRIEGLLHHSLFFDEDFEQHADEIYNRPSWPSKPLFYLSASSKTDPGSAPEGCENLVFLIPLAPGLEDSNELREKYFDIILNRLEKHCGRSLRQHIVVKKSYAMADFEKDYNAFKGNAYGLANTLMQTAFLKPKMKSRKLKNMFYTGQLTVPGPGVPPAIISGKIVSDEVSRQIRSGKI